MNTATTEKRVRVAVQKCTSGAGVVSSARFVSYVFPLAPNESIGYKIAIPAKSLPEGTYTCEIVAEEQSTPGSPIATTSAALVMT